MHSFESKLSASWPPECWQDVSILVAVSGGADSVALLRSLLNISPSKSGRLVVAHFNHKLRGAASDADAAWVCELAKTFSVDCEMEEADKALATQADGDGIEAAARNARHEFFLRTAERLGARHIVTAHTADDQAETILFRILRGTGIAGLAGIPRTRSVTDGISLIRPLLNCRRTEVLRYLADLSQPFRDDETNQDRQFARNRIRHDLLPLLLSQYHSGAADSLLRLGKLAAEAQPILESHAREIRDRAIMANQSPKVILDLAKLRCESDYMLREVFITIWKQRNWSLQGMSYERWDSLVQTCRSQRPSSIDLPDGVHFQVTADTVEISVARRVPT